METKVLLPITFDNVRDKNIEQLRVLNRAIFPINYPERMYQDVLACGEVTHLAYHNDVLIGAIACRLEKIPGGAKLYILTLGVLAPYRGMGVGTRLIDRCFSLVSTSLPEVESAYLHVQSNNTDAIEFYKKFGFEVGETVPNYYPRLTPPDAVVLQRKLLTHGNGTSMP